MIAPENRKCTLLKSALLASFGIATVLFLIAATSGTPEIEVLNSSMFDAIDRIEFHDFNLEKHERIDGIMGYEKWKVEVNYKPYWISMDRTTPEDGPKLYWHENKNDGDAKVDPNGFPWIDLYLDPRGKTLNKKAHHNIFSLGLKHFGNVWHSMCYKNGVLRDEIEVLGTEKVDGRVTWVLSLEIPEYSSFKIKVKKDESIFTISERYLVPADKIVMINPDVDDIFDVDEGQEILVPTHYASSGKLWLDQETSLPIKQEVYDEKGLYERYVYLGVQVNNSH